MRYPVPGRVIAKYTHRMGSVWSAVWGFVGGLFGWFIANFVSQPVLNLFALRAEAARVLALYESFDSYDPDNADDPQAYPANDVAERRKTLSGIGAQLVAFDRSNQIVARLVRAAGLRPRQAGDNLILLSAMRAAGVHNEEIHNRVMKQLRLGHKIGAGDYRH